MRSLVLLATSLALCWAPPSSGQDKKNKDKQVDPQIHVILPLGAAAGQTTKLTIRGLKLEEVKEVKVQHGKAKIVSKGKANVPDKNPEKVGDTQIVVEVTLDAKLASERVQVTVLLPEGETKPHPLLVDTTLPLVKEKEGNDGFRQAQEIKLPVVIEGSIERARDVDTFKFAGRKGQNVALEVLAARYGSPLDSILTIYNEAGAQIATNDDTQESVDARLEVTLPADGVYFVVLMDAHDVGSMVHAYRLVVK